MGNLEALLTRLYEAYNRKDVDAVVAGMHPEIDWPSLFSEGRVVGREAVRALLTRQFQTMDPEITPVAMTRDAQGRVRVRVNYVVRDLKGKLFTEEDNTNVFSFRDGLIVGMDWD
ncbi:MAG: nuclear transport factor 2 family protein [Caulobacter sp.]|nr:nuclear transport factor 2 family protein [Caulobacter sp.]